MNTGDAVLVRWYDIMVYYGTSEWEEMESAETWIEGDTKPLCKTVGFYLGQDDKYTYITDSLMVLDDEYTHVGNVHAIVTGCIEMLVTLQP